MTEDDTFNALRKAPFKTVLDIYHTYPHAWDKDVSKEMDALLKPHGWSYHELLQALMVS